MGNNKTPNVSKPIIVFTQPFAKKQQNRHFPPFAVCQSIQAILKWYCFVFEIVYLMKYLLCCCLCVCYYVVCNVTRNNKRIRRPLSVIYRWWWYTMKRIKQMRGLSGCSNGSQPDTHTHTHTSIWYIHKYIYINKFSCCVRVVLCTHSIIHFASSISMNIEVDKSLCT